MNKQIVKMAERARRPPPAEPPAGISRPGWVTSRRLSASSRGSALSERPSSRCSSASRTVASGGARAAESEQAIEARRQDAKERMKYNTTDELIALRKIHQAAKERRRAAKQAARKLPPASEVAVETSAQTVAGK